MRHCLKLIEAQKTACALDRVNGTKHTSQRVTIVGIFLQPDQFPVQPVQILVTLDQKIFDDFAIAVTLVHRRCSLYAAWAALCPCE